MATTNDSMLEGLKRLLTPISQLKILPDADPGFLDSLEQMIIQYIKSAGQQQTQNVLGPQATQGQPDPTMGMSGLAPGGMGGQSLIASMGQPNQMAPGGAAGGGMGGLTSPSSINPDELRRMLAGTGGIG